MDPTPNSTERPGGGMPTHPRISLISARTALGLAIGFVVFTGGCEQSDVGWDTGREQIYGEQSEAAQIDERWRMYRNDVVQGLDLMKRSLGLAAREGHVTDRTEIEQLTARVTDLRDRMSAAVNGSAEDLSASRIQLRGEFESLRRDVDDLLNRLGHSPDEIARWQDKS